MIQWGVVQRSKYRVHVLLSLGVWQLCVHAKASLVLWPSSFICRKHRNERVQFPGSSLAHQLLPSFLSTFLMPTTFKVLHQILWGRPGNVALAALSEFTVTSYGRYEANSGTWTHGRNVIGSHEYYGEVTFWRPSTGQESYIPTNYQPSVPQRQGPLPLILE